MRIAKYIANSGYCSRRDAEKLIIKGIVYVNHKICNKPNTNVHSNDLISINNKIIKLENIIKLWQFYKPIKVICTNRDPENRKTIFDFIPKNLPRLISIGRLDYMSEGLLLLTNNGDLARKFELPSSNILRVYRLIIKGNVSNKILADINSGISINGINYKKIKVNIEKKNKIHTSIICRLKEGKNREIRNICKFFKWEVIKLIRIQFGKYKLVNQKKGEIREIKNLEI